MIAAFTVLAMVCADSAFAYTEVSTYNWAGYSVNFTNSQDAPLGVSGTWNVPPVACTMNGANISGSVGAWVGLGGVSTNNLEQVGTDSRCTKGVVSYRPFFEITPGGYTPGGVTDAKPVYFKIKVKNKSVAPIVNPGDTMQAEVTDQGGGYFVYQMTDESRSWSFTFINIDQRQLAIPLTADWVVEDPNDSNIAKTKNDTWPQFDRVTMMGSLWAQNGPLTPLASGSSVTRYTLYQPFHLLQIASTNDIASNGTDFAVYWGNF